ncbi:MAG: glutaredoxin family protein [Scytonematopsis contorta HA4267-MV1]|jgi:glutaredoxin|nr:glutaredoxin family protein [Scytonematopsis contorta HA4267-MV1]
MRLILYSKSGCHLCEGLQEKLKQMRNLKFDLEVRDIMTREDWFLAYQYEVPVLFVDHEGTKDSKEGKGEKLGKEEPIPRPSPRLTVVQLEQFLQTYL